MRKKKTGLMALASVNVMLVSFPGHIKGWKHGLGMRVDGWHSLLCSLVFLVLTRVYTARLVHVSSSHPSGV